MGFPLWDKHSGFGLETLNNTELMPQRYIFQQQNRTKQEFPFKTNYNGGFPKANLHLLNIALTLPGRSSLPQF